MSFEIYGYLSRAIISGCVVGTTGWYRQQTVPMVGKSCSIISVAEDVLVRPAGTIIRPYQWSSALRVAIVASGCPGGTVSRYGRGGRTSDRLCE